MIKKLAASIREYKKQSILAPLTVSLEVVMEVIIPLLMAKLIDKGIEAGDMSYILKMGGILCLCCLLSLAFGVMAGKYAAAAMRTICGGICTTACRTFRFPTSTSFLRPVW